jgi:uncharacterized membrane-anchored protein YhcB (DUF1043 family)
MFMDSGLEMSWLWGTGIAGVLVGTACGIGIGLLLRRGHRQRVAELENELARLQSDFDGYRDKVNQHFLTTSELVQKMTDSYRDVYEHLAAGSEQLCRSPVTTPSLDFTEQPVLEHPEQEPPAREGSVNESSDIEKDLVEDTDGDTFLGDAPHVPHLDPDETLTPPRSP